jgi:hypothetical protein
MTDEPVGLVAGEAFREYMAELREVWPRRDELMPNQGAVRPENGLFA